MKNHKMIFTWAFLFAEGILYYLILTTQGSTLVASNFCSILLCFLFVLAMGGTPLLILGMAGTVAADYFLVICNPMEQLWGMVCFLIVQALYAIFLHRQGYGRGWLAARLGVCTLIAGIALVVLGKNADALAIVSVLYYANIVINAVMAFGRFSKFPKLAIGFILFILCDTVIGLQVASRGYLPIVKGSLLHRIIFMDFNLPWFFYLPSQVLIALTAADKNK